MVKIVDVNDINIDQDGTETVKNIWSNEFTDPFLSTKRTLTDKVAVGVPYLEKLGDYWQAFGSYFILNFAGSGENNIKNDTIRQKGGAVETREETEISFIDMGNFLPNDIYMIKGRKYVCEKLEFTIDENGVNKLKRGYFFEVN